MCLRFVQSVEVLKDPIVAFSKGLGAETQSVFDVSAQADGHFSFGCGVAAAIREKLGERFDQIGRVPGFIQVTVVCVNDAVARAVSGGSNALDCGRNRLHCVRQEGCPAMSRCGCFGEACDVVKW